MTAPTVAAFDFDGTITRRDTLLAFLRHVRGGRATAGAVFAESFRIARALGGAGSREKAKERLLVRLLAGRPVTELAELAEAYADEVVARRLRPQVQDRITTHRRRGDDVVIVTASPELYVTPIGRRLGVDAVLGTRLEVDGDGLLTGRLLGANCRGPEKVERLRAWLDERGVGEHSGEPRVVAYGDSSGDAELLAFADVGVRLLRGRLPAGEI